jgi:hypothetical protein
MDMETTMSMLARAMVAHIEEDGVDASVEYPRIRGFDCKTVEVKSSLILGPNGLPCVAERLPYVEPVDGEAW